ncbi:DNA replication/repair protein RecF [Pseudohoeflea coraliihabitans]|uniref:DNA replication and repair protein RecF n=1 Tax=Pseudohoeflea coraliihabitans TaxID=2860393 RepID=A0ABS6WQG5_9HYPH|nr:DNA replication/repair protein RecF [Pseudohoeflea sp. DP4N28-3]MBW3097632.1 DNA replication/repair protein RecF [Pseudohoeflea sp. DP4N28-3]
MEPPMHISRLKLGDFRNYARAELVLSSRHVVLTGHNGAGKTNLMEAVSLLSPGRGMRRAAYGDLVRSGAPGGFSVFAEVDGMEGPVEIGTGHNPQEDSGRQVRINGTPARGADELLDHSRILWLTPAMDGLFTGPAADRRRFLDRLVLSIDPAHGKRALDFERAMRSRNRLLAEGRTDRSWLDGLEAQMAELGVAMLIARRELVGLLTQLIDTQDQGSCFPRALLALEGFESVAAIAGAGDAEAAYATALEHGRGRDQAAGRTLEGPHRMDLAVSHRGKAIAAALCSTGEQKALMIGLILAHAGLVRNLVRQPPLLLLDEIAAHLDAERRVALFDLIDELGGQAFMTGTDRSLFEALDERGQFLDVQDGLVTPLS